MGVLWLRVSAISFAVLRVCVCFFFFFFFFSLSLYTQAQSMSVQRIPTFSLFRNPQSLRQSHLFVPQQNFISIKRPCHRKRQQLATKTTFLGSIRDICWGPAPPNAPCPRHGRRKTGAKTASGLNGQGKTCFLLPLHLHPNHLDGQATSRLSRCDNSGFDVVGGPSNS